LFHELGKTEAFKDSQQGEKVVYVFPTTTSPNLFNFPGVFSSRRGCLSVKMGDSIRGKGI
jgi:hypothetical protein